MTRSVAEEILPNEAAKIAGVSRSLIQRLVDSGKLRGRRVSGMRLIDKRDVERLATERARRRREGGPSSGGTRGLGQQAGRPSGLRKPPELNEGAVTKSTRRL